MSGGIFGNLFDFNGDGRLDSIEQGMEFMALQHMMEEDAEGELEAAGLSLLDLQMMDEDERREALEEAGLDPDDFDF